MITLGWKVKDRVSGFTGIATARAIYLYGCVRIEVTTKQNKGEVNTCWFDEAAIAKVGNGVIVKPKPTGGPRVNPTHRSDPKRY